MSLILKGIDLPHEEINLTITRDGRIYLDNKYHLIAEAIQIPVPHGRIIDEDEIIMWGADWKKYRGMFDEIPTILEAEE